MNEQGSADVWNVAGWQSAPTPHAEIPVQQRSADRSSLECLLQYGRREFDDCGCEIVVFGEASLNALARQEPQEVWLRAIERRVRYAVCNSDGMVVTTAHRFRRVIRDKSISSFPARRSRRPRILHNPARRPH